MASEFERQREALLDRGYADLAGMPAVQFVDLVEPLRAAADQLERGAWPDPADGRVPFVLVVSGALLPAEPLVPLLHLAGSSRPGILDRNHGEEGLAPYRPLPDLGVPDARVYLLAGIERGDEFRDVRPEEALHDIRARGRSPLTIHEGIALVTLFPEVLRKNHCFMLSGSRRGGRRVPAIWISGQAPKLGWCWDGNPHTWLGSASATARLAAG